MSHALDALDHRILLLLRADGRMTNADLAAAVGLSASACLRRVKMLEASGVISGYTALIDQRLSENMAVVIAHITLERQTEDYLARFEAAIRKCPEVRKCDLMTGASDYLVRVEITHAADYERVHKDVLSRLPGVSRIQSSFAIRSVI
ncbi:MAG: Lrp/AsnC family transcriptional regulator [Rhizobiales bacterium]|nr:Lrp/AsnC family transcriptional regulator [Hyphomicrobiales bacterium]